MCVVMLIQCLDVVENLATRITLAGESSLIRMKALMPIQCSTVMKSLAASLVSASVRTLTRMPAVVGLEG